MTQMGLVMMVEQAPAVTEVRRWARSFRLPDRSVPPLAITKFFFWGGGGGSRTDLDLIVRTKTPWLDHRR